MKSISYYSLFLSLSYIFISTICFSQEFNQNLLVKYDKQELESLKTNSKEYFELLNYYVTDGFYFIDMPDKPIDYKELKKIDSRTGEVDETYVITERDMENFNPLEYNCEYHAFKNSYYKLGNTGKLLIIPSKSDFNIAIDNKKRQLQNK